MDAGHIVTGDSTKDHCWRWTDPGMDALPPEGPNCVVDRWGGRCRSRSRRPDGAADEGGHVDTWPLTEYN
jgi:hypothetical protein